MFLTNVLYFISIESTHIKLSTCNFEAVVLDGTLSGTECPDASVCYIQARSIETKQKFSLGESASETGKKFKNLFS